MQVLFDLQDEIADMPLGAFPTHPILEPNTAQKASLIIMEQDGAKTLCITNRTAGGDGLTINMHMFKNLRMGDRITVSGRTGSDAPVQKWSILIHRGGGNFCHLEQHREPLPTELFVLSYLLDEADLQYPIRLRSNHWGNETAYMDIFVDDITITRSSKNKGIIKDNREIIYSLATDNYAHEGLTRIIISHETDDIPAYLRVSGDPEYSLQEVGDSKTIYVRRRVHDWDGIDVCINIMALKLNNRYTITVRGRPEGKVPEGAQMMLQILPGYVWRDNKNVHEGEDFVLEHTFSNAEIVGTEYVRIASTPEGAKMSFVITDIVLKKVD